MSVQGQPAHLRHGGVKAVSPLLQRYPQGGRCPRFLHGGLGQARAGGQQLQLAHVFCSETADVFCKDCLVAEVRRVQDISFILKHILLT